MAIVYLSLGSNKGDRIGYVQQAASLLGADENITIVRTSAFYETEPWNMNTQTWFVNAIVEAKTKYSPVKKPFSFKKLCISLWLLNSPPFKTE